MSSLAPVYWVIGTIAVRGISLAALAVRLRWRQRHQEMRARMALDIVHSLAPGGRIEERCADGTWLRVSAGPINCAECKHGQS